MTTYSLQLPMALAADAIRSKRFRNQKTKPNE